MYKGYNLEITLEELTDLTNQSKTRSMQREKNIKSKIQEIRKQINIENLTKNINTENENGLIDGTKLVDEWFPEIKADVFISHSHADEKLAIKLARWLKDEFNLISFIDSTVWGYADDLLKDFDDLYCYDESTQTYDCDKRNYTTSHVHLMLASALSSMIDKTECLFFINTSNSISFDGMANKTESAWINYELVISKYIEKSYPRRRDLVYKNESHRQDISIIYDADLEHLETLNIGDLSKWDENVSRRIIIDKIEGKNNDNHFLDYLYFDDSELDILNK